MSPHQERPRLAVVPGTGCGGCETVFLDLGEGLLELQNHFELVFFPMITDFKIDALKGDCEIDICLFTGAIRSTHDVGLARELRQASKILVALGACAQLGSVLALANLVPTRKFLQTVYGSSSGSVLRAEHELALPELNEAVLPLAAVVPVDYFVPGCPPEANQLAEVLCLLTAAEGGRSESPPTGTVLGATEVAVCEECLRNRPEGPVDNLRRLHEVDPGPERCLLDAGLLCSGPATRGGCGALCPQVGMPCSGCYGPLPGVADQGARLLGVVSALASISGTEADDAVLRAEAEAIAGELVDPIGTLYRYCFADSILAQLGQPEEDPPCNE